MTLFVDYNQILTDAVNLVRSDNTLYDPVATNATGKLKTVDRNLNDRDYVTMNMPLLDLRIKRVTPDARTGDVYYAEVLIEAEVAVFDLTSRDDAATIRDNLVSSLQRKFQENPHFGASLDAILIGNAEFGTGEDKQEGAFVAGAVLDFHVFLYVNR